MTQKPHKALLLEFSIFSDYGIRVEFTEDFFKTGKKIEAIADQMEETDNDADGVTIYDGNMTTFVFLKPGVTYGTIAHEALHAINQMMKKVGVKEDEKNENTAYHLGYVVNHIIAFWKKQKRAKHGKTRHPHRGKKLRSR
jgi:hypothetical protein